MFGQYFEWLITDWCLPIAGSHGSAGFFPSRPGSVAPPVTRYLVVPTVRLISLYLSVCVCVCVLCTVGKPLCSAHHTSWCVHMLRYTVMSHVHTLPVGSW